MVSHKGGGGWGGGVQHCRAGALHLPPKRGRGQLQGRPTISRALAPC
jgi:hypothetical protein